MKLTRMRFLFSFDGKKDIAVHYPLGQFLCLNNCFNISPLLSSKQQISEKADDNAIRCVMQSIIKRTVSILEVQNI